MVQFKKNEMRENFDVHEREKRVKLVRFGRAG